MYNSEVPKLWNETIESHRREVRDAILDSAAAQVAQHGLLSVTMSQIAEATGIGRATLYKYFGGVEAILMAWHERQVSRHLDQLVALGNKGGDAGTRLAAVLEAYALIVYEHHSTELAALGHRGEHSARAQHHLRHLIRELLAKAVESGVVRGDIAPDELAGFCLHALSGASSLSSKPAVRRLLTVTLAGLRPQS